MNPGAPISCGPTPAEHHHPSRTAEVRPRFGRPARHSRPTGAAKWEKLEIIPERGLVLLAHSLDHSPYRTQSRLSVLNVLLPLRKHSRNQLLRAARCAVESQRERIPEFLVRDPADFNSRTLISGLARVGADDDDRDVVVSATLVGRLYESLACDVDTRCTQHHLSDLMISHQTGQAI